MLIAATERLIAGAKREIFSIAGHGPHNEENYSKSSSPSRPRVLEMTVKGVPGGIVSNWLCDHVKLGQRLTIKGPAGRFSCFNFPAAKMLFIGAGSGITPLMAMSR